MDGDADQKKAVLIWLFHQWRCKNVSMTPDREHAYPDEKFPFITLAQVSKQKPEPTKDKTTNNKEIFPIYNSLRFFFFFLGCGNSTLSNVMVTTSSSFMSSTSTNLSLRGAMGCCARC